MFLAKNTYRVTGKCYEKVSKWPIKVRRSLVALFVLATLATTSDLHYIDTSLYNEVGQHHKLADFIMLSNPTLSLKQAMEIVNSSFHMSSRFGVDNKLILAVAKVESNYSQYAISKTGAYGVMQVIPSWHKEKILLAKKELGNPEIFNVHTNMYLGSWTLQDCILKNNGAIKKALMCYSGNTSEYDKKVIKVYNELIRI